MRTERLRLTGSSLMLALALIALLWGAPESATQARPQGAFANPGPKAGQRLQQVFDVPATAGQPWFDSGIDLETGEEASITASGKVHYCDNCAGKPGMPSNDVGPDGFDQVPADSDFLVPSLPAHSLIARVGSRAAVFVAKGPTIVKGRGRLRFSTITSIPTTVARFTSP